MFELDHIFICTTEGAAEADVLAEFGLTEGAPNTHPGQGTACRRFFFSNAMLELLWVRDASEAGSELIRPTRLLDRWRDRSSGASPFGICLRRSQSLREELPFPSWEYRPPYLTGAFTIHIANNSSKLAEPMLFFLDFAQQRDSARSMQPMEHKAGFQKITALRVISPAHEPASAEVATLERLGIATFVTGDKHSMEIEFDGNINGNRMDFRPLLPLSFLW